MSGVVASPIPIIGPGPVIQEELATFTPQSNEMASFTPPSQPIIEGAPRIVDLIIQVFRDGYYVRAPNDGLKDMDAAAFFTSAQGLHQMFDGHLLLSELVQFCKTPCLHLLGEVNVDFQDYRHLNGSSLMEFWNGMTRSLLLSGPRNSFTKKLYLPLKTTTTTTTLETPPPPYQFGSFFAMGSTTCSGESFLVDQQR